MPSDYSMSISLKIVESSLLYAKGLFHPAQFKQIRFVLGRVIISTINFGLITIPKQSMSTIR